ncbi:NAD(P)H-dependent flavin oxidoreductase [Algibacter mikhailovii]|uniref:NAD(P)H-dependent flavin oxidoreductase n=1 Tax=Algibacter mikhailovii TaxID=425498 RepID=UPI00249415EF|nr:nitronate monooxygenase [Algibacter mikhailovii]
MSNLPLNKHSQKLIKLLGIQLPIVQAPVGGVAIPNLTAAVSNAGCLGGTALSWSDPAGATQTIKSIQSKTKRPFYANYVLNFEPKSLRTAVELGVHIIQFSWGMPTQEIIEYLKNKSVVLGVQVTSKESALQAIALGANYLVCQGTEAGGHVHASKPLEIALKEVLSVSEDIPILASGGISTKNDIIKYLNQGAAGVVMGTRFVATKESGAHEDYKHAIVAAKKLDTVQTVCMNKGWESSIHRILRNSTFKNWESEGCPKIGNRPGENDIIGKNAHNWNIERYSFSAPTVGVTGEIEAMTHYAGESVDKINDIPTVHALIENLIE